MRKIFVYIQYPRLIFADLLYVRSAKTILGEKTLRQLIEEDMKRYVPKRLGNEGGCIWRLNYMLAYDKIFRTVFYFRINQSEKLSSSLTRVFSLLFLKPLSNIEIGINGDGYIDGGLRIVHTSGSIVAPHIAGRNFSVYQGVTVGSSSRVTETGVFAPTIGNNVTIFANSVVAGPIKIGDDVKIGAGSIVMKNVPSNCVVAGNPARIIKLNGNDVDIPL